MLKETEDKCPQQLHEKELKQEEILKIVKGKRDYFFDQYRKDGRDHSHDLEGADFSDLKLSGMDFGGLCLSKANFSNTFIYDCNFGGADLSGVNFKNAVIKGTSFISSDMFNTNFEGAILQHVMGDGKRILSLELLPYPIVLYDSNLSIGCKTKEINKWKKLEKNKKKLLELLFEWDFGGQRIHYYVENKGIIHALIKYWTRDRSDLDLDIHMLKKYGVFL